MLTSTATAASLNEGRAVSLVKRSMSLSGHRTSIALEQPFWDEIDRIASARKLSRAALVAEVDDARDAGTNLASALRLLVIATLQADRDASSD